MTTKQKEAYEYLKTLPDDLLDEAIRYMKYLAMQKSQKEINHEEEKEGIVYAPNELIIKSEEDLINKIEVGLKDYEEGRVYSADEVFKKLDNV